MSEERFNELINLFLDKAIDDDGVRELRQAIDSDPALKEAFIRRYQLHRALTVSLAETAIAPAPQPTLGLLSFAAAGSAFLAFVVVSLLVGLSYVFESQQKAAAVANSKPNFAVYQPTSPGVDVRRIDNARARFASEVAVVFDNTHNQSVPARSRTLVKVDNEISLNGSRVETDSSQQQWSAAFRPSGGSENGFSKAGFSTFQTVLP
jgi:hypothetical protein